MSDDEYTPTLEDLVHGYAAMNGGLDFKRVYFARAAAARTFLAARDAEVYETGYQDGAEDEREHRWRPNPYLAAHDAEVARAARVLPSVEDAKAEALAAWRGAAHDYRFAQEPEGGFAGFGVPDVEWALTRFVDRADWREFVQWFTKHEREAEAVIWADGYEKAKADAPSREQVEREAAEKALREAADEFDTGRLTGIFYGPVDYARSWLRARADRLATGGEA